MSRIIEGRRRIGFNVAHHDSLDKVAIRNTDQGPLLLTIEEHFDELPDERKGLCLDMFNGAPIQLIKGFPMIANECNMDPLAHSQPVLDMVVRLAVHFGCSFMEVVGIQQAAQSVPHTTYFFWTAGYMLLQVPARTLRTDRWCGFGIGYLLLELQLRLLDTVRLSNEKMNARRFSNYNIPRLPLREQWDNKCYMAASHALHICAAHPEPPRSQKAKETLFLSIHKRAVEFAARDEGDLTINHSGAQQVVFGLWPNWLLDCAYIDEKGLYIKYYNDKYPMQNPLSSKKGVLDSFVTTLQTRWKVVYGRIPSKRWLENLLCKIFRVLRAIDGKINNPWKDLLGIYQMLYVVTSEGIEVLSKDGEKQCLDHSEIFRRWPYGDRMETMEYIVRDMNIPTTFPTDDRIANFCFTNHYKLEYPTTGMTVDFEIPDLPPLSEEGWDSTYKFLGHFVGRHAIRRPRATHVEEGAVH